MALMMRKLRVGGGVARWTTAVRSLHHFNAPRLADLVLVRHGESEGNVAREMSIKGDHSLYSGEFKNRHSCNWRLTDRGREQAEAAGEWLRKEDLAYYDRYLVSEYLRAMETAARFNLPDAQWYAEMLLRERDWGQMDLMSEAERGVKMQDELKRRDLDRFYYAPPGGESLATVAQRVDRLMCVLHRELPGKKVLLVCHGDVMWALRTRLERMSQDTFRELQMSGRMVDQLHNGHILHYTRTDPTTGKVAPFFTHMRSVCPWNEKLSPKGWIKINRPVYDNEMMLAIAERVPRMIVSEEYIQQTYRQESSSSLHPNIESPFDPSVPSPKIALNKVVVVNKMTRYQHEESLYGNTGEALKKQMSMRGFVYDRLKASHDHHMDAVDDVTTCLKEHEIAVSVVNAHELSHEAYDGADMVFSAGGDGTFLKAASFVNKPIPLTGLNTDSARSEGNLCCYSIDATCNRFVVGLERLLKGDFEWRNRQRIRVGMVNQEGFKYELPRYALNESQIHREQISSILHAMDFHSYTNETVTEITERLNKDNVFAEDSLDMGYVVREPIINATFGDIRFRKGKARRVSMRSLGWDMKVNLDGLYSVPLNYGVQAVMKICTEPQYALRTVDFSKGDNPRLDNKFKPRS
ncbi:hypothetical protein B5M09_004416 [Aphanomyces astaci]|uniref:Phosphoglycerate mutase (2,3-diphosphoglycerate-dependent) n=1 Tax=Aphanomyces astaci TaxID=112090 RepID=A0A397B1W4_APHAT|nr:hypothetical protein DYB36_000486 [Aphanomyces astaci]RQM11418.1 hypothetical protein B5M09_004416 [Aphanomyces astaci]